MARKDVSLVIRAKNEASNAVNAITSAIGGLTRAQSTLGSSSNEANNALGRLGDALGKLDKGLKGVSATGRVASELDKASAAAARLERNIAETAGELTDRSPHTRG